MPELSGLIRSTELPTLIQYLSKLRQTGTLQLRESDWTARVGFCDGEVVSAAVGEEHGVAAIVALSLMMDQADFVFSHGALPDERDADLTYEQVRYHLDNWSGRPALRLEAVPSRVRRMVQPASGDLPVPLTRRAVQQYLAIDGRHTIREIIGNGSLADGLRCLADLLEFGLIRTESAASRPAFPYPNGSEEAAPVSWSAPERRAAAADLDFQVATTIMGCPRLGFADGTRTHYGQPTALHCCLASGSPRRVSMLEQRDLCLTANHVTCPRLRAALTARAGEQLMLPARPRRVHRPLSLGPGHLTAPDTLAAGTPAGELAHQPAGWAGPLPAGAVGTKPARRVARPPIVPALAIALAIGAFLAWSYVWLHPMPATSADAPDTVQASTIVAPTTPSGP